MIREVHPGGREIERLLAGLPLDALGAGGLVTLAVVALFRAWIVPGSMVNELKAVRDDRIRELIEERTELRAAAAAKEETLRELVAQNSELLEVARASNVLLRALTEAAGRTT